MAFFGYLLALFDTFVTRYNDSDMKFKFLYLQTLHLKIIFENESEMPFRPLCDGMWSKATAKEGGQTG